MYVYKHFKFIFVSLVTLFNTHFEKMITTDSLKSHNPVKSVHCTQILSIVLAIFAYYPGIILNVFAFLLWSSIIGRDQPIILLFLPIMLCCNALKIYLLCSRIRIVVRLLGFLCTSLQKQLITCTRILLERLFYQCVCN